MQAGTQARLMHSDETQAGGSPDQASLTQEKGVKVLWGGKNWDWRKGGGGDGNVRRSH